MMWVMWQEAAHKTKFKFPADCSSGPVQPGGISLQLLQYHRLLLALGGKQRCGCKDSLGRRNQR